MLDAYFESPALFFTVPALFGTVVFGFKMLMMFLGGIGGDLDLDVDTDVDVDVDADHGDSTAAFKFLSVQAIGAFVMGFGWGGLIGLLTFQWPLEGAIVIAVGFGAGLMWLMATLLQAIRRLEGSGHVRIEDSVGREGAVYADVPSEGNGRIRVVIRNRARFFDAIADEPLPTGTRILVVRANSDHTVTVRRI